MFGRATIRLGIGPHSSLLLFSAALLHSSPRFAVRCLFVEQQYSIADAHSYGVFTPDSVPRAVPQVASRRRVWCERILKGI